MRLHLQMNVTLRMPASGCHQDSDETDDTIYGRRAHKQSVRLLPSVVYKTHTHNDIIQPELRVHIQYLHIWPIYTSYLLYVYTHSYAWGKIYSPISPVNSPIGPPGGKMNRPGPFVLSQVRGEGSAVSLSPSREN